MKSALRCVREQFTLGKLIREFERLRDTATNPAEVLRQRDKLNAATKALLDCRKQKQVIEGAKLAAK
jgi:hypothetical protein